MKKLKLDGRLRLSSFFLPSGTKQPGALELPGHALLIESGFIRQSTAGIFTLLPYGQRVVDKLERRIDNVMQSIGASKLAMPTLHSKSLWQKTGRWANSELFKLTDRKGSEYCLAPTHEEHVTKLVSNEVNGYKQLPVRLYQINRKYRDEMRPRGGMLRGKEFLMKDLYTFDDGVDAAKSTYEQVSAAYKALFSSLETPFLVAKADSGNIGGELSHEYHLPSDTGEDTLLHCSACNHVANQELATTQPLQGEGEVQRFAHAAFPDTIFFDVCLPTGRLPNMLQVERQAKQCDPSVVKLLAVQAPQGEAFGIRRAGAVVYTLDSQRSLQVEAGDACPSCSSPLAAVKAIEVGHTFYLGAKYAKQLAFTYSTKENKLAHPEMGCHGIGVTRLLAALAEIKRDEVGLRWPTGLAPFKSVIVASENSGEVAEALYDRLDDAVIDDRFDKGPMYRIKEAERQGIPNILVLGKNIELAEDIAEQWIEVSRRPQSSKKLHKIQIKHLGL
jgi:prolyl-tRNA synthetase